MADPLADSGWKDPFGLLKREIEPGIRVERVVGTGGFGTVYQAQDASFKTKVAIKVLRLPPHLSDESRRHLRRSFEYEAQILSWLSGLTLNVPRPLSAKIWVTRSGDIAPYIIQEWLDGKPLDALIDEARESGRKPFAFEEAFDLLDPVVEALRLAHARVVHRDIKPSNIFLTNVERNVRTKLLDFGISKLIGEGLASAAVSSVTSHELKAFTPAYAAPEQWDPTLGEPTAQSDIFSFALVVLELITLRQALVGSTPPQLMFSCVQAARRSTPRTLGLKVSDTVEALFAKALAWRPQDRPRSIEAWWIALKEAVTSEAVWQSTAGSAAVSRGMVSRMTRTQGEQADMLGTRTTEEQRDVSSILDDPRSDDETERAPGVWLRHGSLEARRPSREPLTTMMELDVRMVLPEGLLPRPEVLQIATDSLHVELVSAPPEGDGVSEHEAREPARDSLPEDTGTSDIRPVLLHVREATAEDNGTDSWSKSNAAEQELLNTESVAEAVASMPSREASRALRSDRGRAPRAMRRVVLLTTICVAVVAVALVILSASSSSERHSRPAIEAATPVNSIRPPPLGHAPLQHPEGAKPPGGDGRTRVASDSLSIDSLPVERARSANPQPRGTVPTRSIPVVVSVDLPDDPPADSEEVDVTTATAPGKPNSDMRAAGVSSAAVPEVVPAAAASGWERHPGF